MPYLYANNIQIYYEIHGTGKPLLLIHGLGASSRDWEYQLDALKGSYKVITFDLRGHGKTDKPRGAYSISMLANDTAEVIKNLSPEPLHVVGHSLGGMIAFQLALDFPTLLKSLTIINSGPAVIFPSFKAKLGFASRFLSLHLFGMHKMSVILAHYLFPKPEQVSLKEKFIGRLSENDPKAYASTLKAFHHWNVTPRLMDLTCPTLVITADHDYTPVAVKQHYVNLIPQAQLKIIVDSRHMTIWDQPEALNRILLAFLGARPSGFV